MNMKMKIYKKIQIILILATSVLIPGFKCNSVPRHIPYNSNLTETEQLDTLVDYDKVVLIRHYNELNDKFQTGNQKNYTPVLMWHGMGDTARGSIEVLIDALQKQSPGILIYSVQVGRNAFADRYSSYFGNVNDQIKQVCELVNNNPSIQQAKKLNFVGFSQGCQFIRGLIQRCDFGLGVEPGNFISIGGQHQGVYGLPNCGQVETGFCDYIRSMLKVGAYLDRIQKTLVQAQYWHDPLHENTYIKHNSFLADINNERYINLKYKKNILKLKNMVLVEFKQDEMVVPRESSLFGFYKPGQATKIIPLEETQLYIEDRLGLKEMVISGRLKKLQIPGKHVQFSTKWFINDIAKVYLSDLIENKF